MDSNTINAIAGIGTLLTAIAAVMIAIRQTQMAKNTQAIAERLEQLEQARETPVIAFSGLSYRATPHPEIKFEVVNAGGGCALDVWVDRILILDRVAGAYAKVPVTLDRRIDVLRDQVVLVESINVNLVNPEKIIAVLGKATSALGRPIEIEYETVEGFLKDLR